LVDREDGESVRRQVAAQEHRSFLRLLVVDLSWHGDVVQAPVNFLLAPPFDDWDVAVWFAEPNTWPYGQAPVDVLRAEPSAVVHAARADRYIVTG